MQQTKPKKSFFIQSHMIPYISVFVLTLLMEAHYIKGTDGFETLATFLPWMSVKLLYVFLALFTVLAFLFLYFFQEIRFRNRTTACRTEYIFLLLYLILGIAYFLSVPMYKTPDEPAHFYRAYELSEGHLVSEASPHGDAAGRNLPKAITSLANEDLYEITFQGVSRYASITLDEHETTFVQFSGAALYAPGTYLPQMIGIRLMRFFTNNLLAILYAARIMNWLLCGLIFYLCIKYLPFAKELAAALLLMPMCMQQYVSISADAFTLAISTALLTFVLYLRFTYTQTMTGNHYLLMYFLVFILCQCKVVYLIFALFLFLIPKERFGAKKNYYVHTIAVAAMLFLIGGGWLLLSTRILDTAATTDTGAKTAFLLHHPIAFLNMIVTTFDLRTGEYLTFAVGSALSWMNIPISALLIYTYLGILAYLVMQPRTVSPAYKCTERLWVLAISLLITLLMFMSLYIQWSPEDITNEIQGVQGRYFIPLLLPTLTAVIPQKNSEALASKHTYSVANALILGINLCVCTILLTYAL